jgi:hypothetical protein
LVALASADPHDPKQIMKYQNQIQLFNMFDEWLREIVSDGDNALEVFKQENT